MHPSFRFSSTLTLAIAATALSVTGAMAQAELSVTSSVSGLKAIVTSTLPHAPGNADADACFGFAEPATSPGGQLAESRGWVVTSEASLGNYTAVSFGSSFEPGPSGTCRTNDGNVALFDGENLVALVYSALPNTPMVGHVEPFGLDGLRVWDGDILGFPVADISLDADGAVSVSEPASEEVICGGSSTVPNIYGQPILTAKAMLEDAGWTATPDADSGMSEAARQEFVDAGLPEVGDCSGTGFGYCTFSYTSGADTLSVITAGELSLPEAPIVARYAPNCPS